MKYVYTCFKKGALGLYKSPNTQLNALICKSSSAILLVFIKKSAIVYKDLLLSVI